MNQDSELHAQGKACFIDDQPLTDDTLHAFPLVSSIAHGKIKSLDFKSALSLPGLVKVLTARDIPGINQIGNIAPDEVLLADNEVVYQGQSIAIMIATTAAIARRAAALCIVEYQELPAVFDAREADRLGMHISSPRSFSLGDIDSCWAHCDVIVEGSAETGAQEHIYLETQTAIAYSLENTQLKIISATQSPGMVQRIIARVLNCAMHKIDVDVLRLGGGFGCKEEQATSWAVMVALAASITQQPVKIALSRTEDMRFTGKRHPYSADFKLGLNKAGKILAYEVSYYQNAGALADLSLSILERSLLHATNSYFIANVRANAVSCRTHLPPNTAFRGFGAPQAMFILECAIFKAAQEMQVNVACIQQENLMQDGDVFPYGMVAKENNSHASWQQLEQDFSLQQQQQQIDEFNNTHQLEKKALAIMPVCFGIAFNAFFLIRLMR
ncbi:hypothetical protein bplSymb_SCF17401P002 [Bathymodiolus platifrons methanotrophic gill symbiont]|uniref:molybdopterin cofactor-binding domain-containing protein n=1 Tax=Bathymodiolus platifrons methanotrophic gill symbiont TaxID=113268 RepID=UPI000B680EAF|nr:molybdopterin cofactor-binding domain-containing protein [Bathymodiolus platifrons methanotrophic gill symbiont]GAW87790.1 hypothetical protein bplSymb_SCF17401P002 [Bathymodiolus platifrons methanotrophic gill symbiont]